MPYGLRVVSNSLLIFAFVFSALTIISLLAPDHSVKAED